MKSHLKLHNPKRTKHDRRQSKYLSRMHKRHLRQKNLGLCAPLSKPEKHTGCFQNDQLEKVEIDVVLSCSAFYPDKKPFGMIEDAQSHFNLTEISCDDKNETLIWERDADFSLSQGNQCYIKNSDCDAKVSLYATALNTTAFTTLLSQFLDKSLTEYADSQKADIKDFGYAMLAMLSIGFLICLCVAFKSSCSAKRTQNAHVIHTSGSSSTNKPLLNKNQKQATYGG